MNANYVFAFAAGIGFVAGLRTFHGSCGSKLGGASGISAAAALAFGIYRVHRGSGNILRAGGSGICCRPVT